MQPTHPLPRGGTDLMGPPNRNSAGGAQLLQDTNSEIKVRVLFFGAARDAAGHSEVDFVLKRAATATNALEEVLEKFPELRRFGRSLLFAVNQEYAGADCEVHDGDELAVFPPVSGGSQEGTSTEEAKKRRSRGETGGLASNQKPVPET